MLALLKTARAARERDWLMILVTFCHGLRASEVVALTADNVRDGFLTVQRLKGSNRTVQPLISSSNPLLSEREPLIDLVRRTPRNQRLFKVCRQHFWRLMQKHAEAAGIPAQKRHPHALKHSIATQMVDEIGVPKLQAYLGHKSGSSTLEYTKPREEDAAASVQRALRV